MGHALGSYRWRWPRWAPHACDPVFIGSATSAARTSHSLGSRPPGGLLTPASPPTPSRRAWTPLSSTLPDCHRVHTATSPAFTPHEPCPSTCVGANRVGLWVCVHACVHACVQQRRTACMGQRGVGCVKVVAITGTLLFPLLRGLAQQVVPSSGWDQGSHCTHYVGCRQSQPVCEHPDCLHVVDVVSRTDVLAARGSDYFSRVARVLEACGNTTGSTRERGRPSKRRRDGATAVVDGGAAGTVSVPWEVDLVVLHERLGRPLVPVSVPDATAQLWVCRRHAQGYRLPAVVSHAAPPSSLALAGTWRSVAVRDGLHTLRGFTGDDWRGSQVHSAGHGAELVPLFSASPGSGSNCSTRKWGTCASALSAIPVVAMRRCSGVATRASDTRCPSGGAV